MDGAIHSLLGWMLRLDAAAVTQLLGRVAKAMVVSIMQEIPTVHPCWPQARGPVGDAPTRAAAQVQGAAHLS